MAELIISIPHPFSQEEALKKMDVLIEEVKKQIFVLDLNERWNGDTYLFSFSFHSGVVCNISGTIKVAISAFEININVPRILEGHMQEIKVIVLNRMREIF